MTESQKVNTRILVLSDTHSALPADTQAPVPFREPLPSADVAIHCGDLTSTGKLHEHRRAVQLLASIQAELKIVIPGNHDLTLDRKYCASHTRLYGWNRDHIIDDIEHAYQLYTNQQAQKAGIRYLVEGTETFTLLNGARLTIYANAYTPEFYDWGFPYPRSEDCFNPPEAQHRVPDFDEGQNAANVDIMVTHGPPQGVLDATTNGTLAGCEHLRKAVARCKPLMHCFGHIHEGWGGLHQRWSSTADGWGESLTKLDTTDEAQVMKNRAVYIDGTSLQHGKETIFVNASIMTVRYKPTQSPWVVDLMLPKA